MQWHFTGAESGDPGDPGNSKGGLGMGTKLPKLQRSGSKLAASYLTVNKTALSVSQVQGVERRR